MSPIWAMAFTWTRVPKPPRAARNVATLRNTSDFRGVYRTLLEDWLGVDAAPIIPNAGSFAKPDLVKP